MSSYFNKGDFSAQHVASSYQKEKDEMPRKSRILVSLLDSSSTRRILHDDPTSARHVFRDQLIWFQE